MTLQLLFLLLAWFTLGCGVAWLLGRANDIGSDVEYADEMGNINTTDTAATINRGGTQNSSTLLRYEDKGTTFAGLAARQSRQVSVVLSRE